MKRLISTLFATVLLTTTSVLAQSGSNSNYIPELVFQNPTLVSGTAGQNGAIYRFNTVANDLDATVKIVGRSSSSVVLTDIDVPDLGWPKAFQPKLGILGTVPANQDWWMEFEMRFYKGGTNNKKKVKGFQVTAIDVDGDGVSIQEYLQMNRVKSMSTSSVSYLSYLGILNFLTNLLAEGTDNNTGIDKRIEGPIQNFNNIDTLGTPVMATFAYEDKDMITFRYGAKSGATTSTAGERLNSLWFKAFSLAPIGTLPVTFHSFTATYDKKNVKLDWTADTDNTFSFYAVEKSTDGKNFTEIGLVNTTGAQQSDYQFRDVNVSSPTGTIFYRLRYKDNRETTYSQIRVVRLKTQENLQLTTYPNPVVSELRISLPNAWQGKGVQLELFNANGVKAQSVKVASASQTETLQMSTLSKGMYIVKASYEGETLEQKVVKY